MKQIIEKAVKGGFNVPDNMYRLSENDIFFRHDFLKAYFGNLFTVEASNDTYFEKHENAMEFLKENPGHKVNPRWEHHAKQLVLSEDRIKYLKTFL